VRAASWWRPSATLALATCALCTSEASMNTREQPLHLTNQAETARSSPLTPQQPNGKRNCPINCRLATPLTTTSFNFLT
jgi:hypothetical protein